MTSMGAVESLSIQLLPLEKQSKSETQEPRARHERGEEPVHLGMRREVRAHPGVVHLLNDSYLWPSLVLTKHVSH